MTLDLTKPILYLITSGATTEFSTPGSPEFENIIELVSAAVDARIQLVQLREKELTARHLFLLTVRAAEITRGTSTRLLVNDRADVAVAAGADGVHLSTRSLAPRIVRETFGQNLLIGASTHSLSEAVTARDDGADFAVFGPVFDTASKAKFGAPLGIEVLEQVVKSVAPFPILALGGTSEENAADCLLAGAAGVSGISMFNGVSTLKETVATIQHHVERRTN